MAFFEFLGNILTSLLVAYLAFTNFLAGSVERLLYEEEAPRAEIEAARGEESAAPAETTTLKDLSKRLAQAVHDSVPRVLLDNKEFQEAALGAAALQEEFEADSSLPLPTRVEHALVNVFCQYRTEDYIRTTTGTGFFIHPKGVILTNAHVAQFLLLVGADKDVLEAKCVIRSGNPATPRYTADLLYISPLWVLENAELVTEETPRGTGERDYALLYVSGTVGEAERPEAFPFVSVDTALLTIYTQGIEVLAAGYPAGALIREGARAKLEPVLASTTVRELFTFGSNYADIFTIAESPVGALGASGGPIVREDGKAIGLIVTKGNEETEGARSLRAITLSYVDRTIIEETGFSLSDNMRGDIAYRSAIFMKALVPFLRELLQSELVSDAN